MDFLLQYSPYFLLRFLAQTFIGKFFDKYEIITIIFLISLFIFIAYKAFQSKTNKKLFIIIFTITLFSTLMFILFPQIFDLKTLKVLTPFIMLWIHLFTLPFILYFLYKKQFYLAAYTFLCGYIMIIPAFIIIMQIVAT